MKNYTQKTILTGDTPTGRLHLGHYVGTLENRVALQDKYKTFIILADLHALTTLSATPEKIKEATYQVALDNLSVGLVPEKVHIFIESQIPEIYELAAIFSMYISHNRALRNPTIKDEIIMKNLGDQFSLGFINYPVYQVADILCVKGDLVPVGKDQEAHLEQTREIARAFNNMANEDFLPKPKALIGRVGKLIGTDGNSKMSKTLGNTIYLSDSMNDVKKKVMTMFTDPTRLKSNDRGHIKGNPVFAYLDAFGKEEHKEQIKEYKEKYTQGKVGDVEVKKYLERVLNTFLDPIREKRNYYENHMNEVKTILEEGTRITRAEAQNTLQQVREVLKIKY